MCQISEQLKFCSCKDVNVSNGNYWILSRRNDKYLKIGQTVFEKNSLKIDKYQIDKLLTRLNENSLFDFDYNPRKDDKLEINLKVNNKEFEYSFIYSKGKWEKNSIYSQEMEDALPPYFDAFLKGKIKNPFKNN